MEVTFQSARGSADAVTKLGTGVSDIGTGGIAALMQAVAENNLPVKAVIAVYAKQPDAIFTVKGSGITSLKQVAGKTIATATFSSSNALWPVVLQANGVDPSTVKLLKADPATLAPMLAQGKVDATINWITVSPAFTNVLKQAGKELSVLPWSTQGLDGYGWSVFASDKMIKELLEVVKKVLRALKKGFDFALANPDAAGADLKAIVPEVNAAEAAVEFRASIPLLRNEITKKDCFGVFEPKLLAATWGWVVKSFNFPANKIDPEKIVDRSFLPK
ncbi:MAG: ABC transporter substrate-binding protein [Candidatus Protistobacter heckmanni]|nr:ABC transporter substrate-binding protein [Candidatus Protistobacter heckmanni]